MTRTDDDIEAIGKDIALAIRARGQVLADAARTSGSGQGAELISCLFEQAAQVAELRTHLHLINRHLAEMPKGPGAQAHD